MVSALSLPLISTAAPDVTCSIVPPSTVILPEPLAVVIVPPLIPTVPVLVVEISPIAPSLLRRTLLEPVTLPIEPSLMVIRPEPLAVPTVPSPWTVIVPEPLAVVIVPWLMSMLPLPL